VWEAVYLWASLYRKKPADGDRLLEQLGLTEKRDAWFMTLSGGQKQRLFIALALINDPDVVFLDELTTGLDPQSRRAIWDLVRGIRDRGKTVFLTTHLMEEAERLCDRVAIMDHGKVIAHGTPRELIASIGVEHVVEFSAGSNALDLAGVRAMAGVRDVRSENGSVLLQVTELHRSVPELLSELGRQGVPLTELRTHSASLEDVFVHLTGRHLRDE
jgi:ABC-2 type transport system ATP-binding protein